MSEKYKTYPIKLDGAGVIGDVLAPVFGRSEEALNYEAAVRSVLDKMSKKAGGVGLAVLNALPKAKDIVIVPYEENGTWGACNATAGDATILEAGKARVRYSPSTWKVGGVCSTSIGAGIGAGDDEILLHELLHAYRRVKGSYNKLPFTKPDKAYDSNEELFAILITNIYMSENGKTKLRKDHAGFTELPAKWATSQGFLSDSDFFNYIEAFWLSDNALTTAVALSTATFNPFKAYKNLKDAQEAAKAAAW
jgi:hypothetical protein